MDPSLDIETNLLGHHPKETTTQIAGCVKSRSMGASIVSGEGSRPYCSRPHVSEEPWGKLQLGVEIL